MVSANETVEITGHLMDHGILSHVLDDIREYGGDYYIDRFDVGRKTDDTSHAVITVIAEDEEALQRLLMRLQTRGVNLVDPGEASVAEADLDGAFPDGFYCTTNLPHQVRLGGEWIEVEDQEMDCGLILDRDADGRRPGDAADVRRPHRHARRHGARHRGPVPAASRSAGRSASWSPRSPARSPRPCSCARSPTRSGRPRPRQEGPRGAAARRSSTPAPRRRSSRWSATAGSTCSSPATPWPPTTSSRPSTAPAWASSLRPRRGDRARPRAPPPGDQHDPPARRHQGGGRAGVLTCGHHVRVRQPRTTFVLAGIDPRRRPAARGRSPTRSRPRRDARRPAGVGFCLMIATTLHSIATGNLLPAWVKVVCVDINPATVTKLTDRGTSRRSASSPTWPFLEQLESSSCPSTGVPEGLPEPGTPADRSASGPSAALDRRHRACATPPAIREAAGRARAAGPGDRRGPPDDHDSGRRPPPGWPPPPEPGPDVGEGRERERVAGLRRLGTRARPGPPGRRARGRAGPAPCRRSTARSSRSPALAVAASGTTCTWPNSPAVPL